MLQIIADSGSTKIDWLIISDKHYKSVQTIGYNPNYSDAEEFKKTIQNKIIKELPATINSIHFYGAGCSSKINRKATTALLKSIFNTKNVTVKDDLLGAARALCKNQPGIVSILGTGSNFCKYNGKKIIFRRISMGYLLADEGSAYAIGKSLIRNYIDGTLSKKSHKLFFEKYALTRFDLIPTIYSEADSHIFIAGFSRFAFENNTDKSIRKIIYQTLEDFVKKYLLIGSNNDQYSFYFVGSIAFHFSDILKEVLDKHNLKLGNILKSPIEEIANFHRNHEQLI